MQTLFENENQEPYHYFLLGQILFNGIGVKQNIPLALTMFLKSSALDYAFAHNILGQMFVDPSILAKTDFCKNSKSFSKILYKLISKYHNIHIGDKDDLYRYGIKLLEKACRQKLPEAFTLLFKHHAENVIVQNRYQIYNEQKLLTLASASLNINNADLLFKLGMHYHTIAKYEPVFESVALEAMLKSLQLGNREANKLCKEYLQKSKLQKNRRLKLFEQYLKILANNHDPQAILLLEHNRPDIINDNVIDWLTSNEHNAVKPPLNNTKIIKNIITKLHEPELLESIFEN